MLEQVIRELLKELGQDPEREGLEKTPVRVAKALEYLTYGYQQDARALVNEALVTEQ